jgi:hypothetical protein
MNRRSFLKTVTICGVTLPMISIGRSAPSDSRTELEELYAYIESKPIWNFKTNTPFKLTEVQKEILKVMHEHPLVFFVKGRQIGASLLTAGYSAWRWERNSPSTVNIFGAAANWALMTEWNRKLTDFCPRIPTDKARYDSHSHTLTSKTSHWPQPGEYSIVTLEELNFNEEFKETLDSLYDDFTVNQCQGKIFVVGTPDDAGRLYAAIKDPRYKKFVQTRHPVTHFPELWDGDRLRGCIMNGIPERELFT